MSRVNPTVDALIADIRIVNHYHNLGDAVYRVREYHGADDGYTGDSWQHPKVIEYSAAVERLRDMGALDPLPPKPITLRKLTATLIAEAFSNYRFDVREDGKDGRGYIAEIPIKQAAENEASQWWAKVGNKEMAAVEAVRWAEGQALQMAARAFATTPRQ